MVAVLLTVGALLKLVNPDLDIVATLANVTVVFLLFIYALVIVSALKLRGTEEREDTYRANTPLLYVGIVGNVVLLAYVIIDDPSSLLWVAGLLAVGFVLYLAEYLSKKRHGGRVGSTRRRRHGRHGGLIMQVIVATDGSKASLVAAQQFKSFADPGKIDRDRRSSPWSARWPWCRSRTSCATGPPRLRRTKAVNLSFEAEARGATAAR